MFNGLNLGMAINIADGASVNAGKISASIEKLLNLSNKLSTDTKKASSGTDALANSFDHANRGAHNASTGVRGFGSTLSSLEPRLISFRAGIVRLFPYISLVAGLYAVKRGFDETMDKFTEYEYAMKNMQAATGYSVSEMGMLDRQFRAMAVSGRFSAKEIAEAGYDLTTTLPIEASAVKDLTQSVLAYATATQYSVKESGLDILALLSKMGRPMSDSTILFDQMALALNKTSLTAQRLSEMLKITGTEALGMGLPFNQLLALMGRTDLYYRGGEGGTRLRMMFQTLAQAGMIHQKVLAQYGLTMQDVDIKSQGLYNVLSKLKGMQYGDLSRLVGGYSAGLVMRLSNDVKYMKDLEKEFTEDKARGTTGTMYDVQIKSLDGRRKQLKNIVTEMQLTLGDLAKQPYADYLGKIAGFITDITGKMKQNSGVLVTIFRTVSEWLTMIGKEFAAGMRSVLGWTGLLENSQEKSQGLVRNHLLPFLVFAEVIGIRIWKFIKGFASGFWDGAQLVWKAVTLIGGWLGDVLGWVLPFNDKFNTLGYVLGIAVPLLWGFGKAAAVLRLVLGWLGVELEGVSIATALWNTILALNPIVAVGTAVLAVMFVIHKHKAQIQDWIDGLPDWAQAIASFFTLGFLNDEKIGSRLVKLWDSVTGTITDAFFWVVNRLNDLLGLLPKSIKVMLGINDLTPEDMKKAENKFRYGSEFAPTPAGESVLQYKNPKSEAQAGAMLTDKNKLDAGVVANATNAAYANFGQKTATNWGLPATHIAKKGTAGKVDVKGAITTPVDDKPKSKLPSKILSPEMMEKAGVSEDDVSEFMDQANTDMEGYKTEAANTMKKLAGDTPLPKAQVVPATVPQAMTQNFKFGDINIDAKGGDPEKMARELVPFIKKVIHEELNR